jgi:hypothetical protein
MSRAPDGHSPPGLGIDEHDLRRLGRAVDAGNEAAAPFRHVLLGQLGGWRLAVRGAGAAGWFVGQYAKRAGGIIPRVMTTGQAPTALFVTRAGTGGAR